MRTGTYYFYIDSKKVIDHKSRYEVIEVPVYNDWIPAAEEKAEQLARIMGKKLAGGLFNGTCKPHDFERNYTIYKYQM